MFTLISEGLHPISAQLLRRCLFLWSAACPGLVEGQPCCRFCGHISSRTSPPPFSLPPKGLYSPQRPGRKESAHERFSPIKILPGFELRPLRVVLAPNHLHRPGTATLMQISGKGIAKTVVLCAGAQGQVNDSGDPAGIKARQIRQTGSRSGQAGAPGNRSGIQPPVLRLRTRGYAAVRRPLQPARLCR